MERLRILTLNLWAKQGPWPERLALVRDGLAGLQPDVIGLQEVLRHRAQPFDQSKEVGDALGYHAVYGCAWHIGGGLEFGNAILSRYPIVRSQGWALPLSRIDAESRSLLFAEIDAPCGRVPIFCTHLDWQFDLGAVRRRQVSFIADRIEETVARSDAAFPAILVGDFNAEPDSDEMRFLRGLTPIDGRSVYFADCFALAGDGDGATYARANTFAAREHEPDRRIDYVYVARRRRDGAGVPASAKVVFREAKDGVFASDHFGVLAEVSAGIGGSTPGTVQ